jgi:hypothetical protein
MKDVVFILAPPRSFSSVICAMLGQHPQMYGLPELYLFTSETVGEWSVQHRGSTYQASDGLLRALAQICFGEQTDQTVGLAAEWIKERSHFTTGAVLDALAEMVHPLILVEKSPSLVYRLEYLRRCHAMFPHARYIHLVRHPRSYCEGVIRLIGAPDKLRQAPLWLVHLATFPEFPTDQDLKRNRIVDLDPQRGWYHSHATILQFLRSVPGEQKIMVRGEDVLSDRGQSLRAISGWMGLRTDPAAIEEMMHPEHSPFACYGPPAAPQGNDAFFMESPTLRPGPVVTGGLDKPLSWRTDGQEFLPMVKEMALSFGYA